MLPMNLLDSLLLGALEGFTEFLPISSTGHLILASELLGLPDSSFHTSFLIAVQLGAIFAVVVRYWKRFLELPLLVTLSVAFIPTGLVGFLVYPYVKVFLLGNPYVVVSALALGGIALIIFEYFHTESPEDGIPEQISYRQAVMVGMFQAVAIIPGVSRSAATIVGGLLSGLRRTTIVEFSFLLAVPTMLAATGYDLLKSHETFVAADLSLLAVGFVTAFTVALVSMRFMISLVRRYGFIPFGVYRILLAVVFYLVVLA